MGVDNCCCDPSLDPRNSKKQNVNDNMILANAGLEQLTKCQLIDMNTVWSAIFHQLGNLKKKGFKEEVAQGLNPIELVNDPCRERDQKRIFDQIDTDGDGLLTLKESKAFLRRLIGEGSPFCTADVIDAWSFALGTLDSDNGMMC